MVSGTEALANPIPSSSTYGNPYLTIAFLYTPQSAPGCHVLNPWSLHKLS